ncbi:MAG: hypothetical protein LJE93_07710 [Acidobacteria bacterium]|jgi:hypothetical protein|nr:hypothetical protein [Acidobacteriota bacterium]
MPSTALIVDPLTLKGRELLACADRLEGIIGGWEYRHTDVDEEHQIVDFAGGSALVPPLGDAESLAHIDVVIVASDGWSSRHDHLLTHLEIHPDSALVDLTGFDELRDHTNPSVGEVDSGTRRLRVAHWALFACSRMVEVLAHFSNLRGSLAVVDPASAYGKDAVEILARQAAQRVQGAEVEERIHGHVLAFSAVEITADEIQEDASLLLPEFPLAVTRTLAGCFHGHLAHLGLSFDHPVEPDDVRDALEQADALVIESLPLSLDSVPDREQVIVSPPVISADGTQLALTCMADALRIGALTAVEIVEHLL